MVLTSRRWYGTCQFTNANEDREVAEPDDNETVDETSRSATVEFSKILSDVVGFDSLLEAGQEDAAQKSERSNQIKSSSYTRRLSHVHIKPQERPVIDTRPKRRCER